MVVNVELFIGRVNVAPTRACRCCVPVGTFVSPSDGLLLTISGEFPVVNVQRERGSRAAMPSVAFAAVVTWAV